MSWLVTTLVARQHIGQLYTRIGVIITYVVGIGYAKLVGFAYVVSIGYAKLVGFAYIVGICYVRLVFGYLVGTGYIKLVSALLVSIIWLVCIILSYHQ